MELQQLRFFIAAAESESFTRGARRVFVSQPALSASISRLETELGVRLFTRNRRNVALTPAGRTLLKRARKIVEELHQARDELIHHDEQRRLRLGVINTLSIAQVARLLEQYRRENPGLKLRIHDATGPEMEQLARQGRIDMALTLLPQHPDSDRPFVQAQPLFSEGYAVAMASDHPLSQSSSISLDDIQDEPFIARSHCEHRRALMESLKTREIRLNTTYITSQDDRALALVRSGVGIAIVPEHYNLPGIVKRPLTDITARRTIGFEWNPGDNQEEIDQLVAFASAAHWP